MDATCGNGHDAERLAELVEGGHLYAIDQQQAAIDATQARLEQLNSKTTVSYHCQSHVTFPPISPERAIKGIIYNLGYLPGGDKSVTTTTETTLESLREAVERVCPGGFVCVTCYPGHTAGACEQEAVIRWACSLAPKEFCCTHNQWLNRKAAPSLLLIQKAIN